MPMLRIDTMLSAAWLGAMGGDPATRRFSLYGIKLYGEFLERERLPLNLTTAADVRRFSEKLSREHTPSVSVGVVYAVKRFYRWAEGLCRDVAKGVSPDARYRPYSRETIGVDEALRILDSAGGVRNRAILSLIIRCDLKPRDIVSATTGGVLLVGRSGEIRLSNGAWMPLTRACAADLSSYMDKRSVSGEEQAEGLLFTAETRENRGISLADRTLRRIVRVAFERAGMPRSAGEYCAGSAAVDLAIAEGEPSEVIVSLCDRTYPYRNPR